MHFNQHEQCLTLLLIMIFVFFFFNFSGFGQAFTWMHVLMSHCITSLLQ